MITDVCENYQGYTWKTALEESSLVLAFLFIRIPAIHLKRSWPMAQLQAFIGNALGGKDRSGKALPAWKSFAATDFLPFFARPEGFEIQNLLPPHICSLIIAALDEGDLSGASWVIQAIELDDSIDRVQKVAEEFDRLKLEQATEDQQQQAQALA